MDAARLYDRYHELQRYVGWTDDDRDRIVAAAGLSGGYLHGLVEDFYAEIERHPTSQGDHGRSAQIERLKGTLVQWIRELLAGQYDADYVVPPVASRMPACRDRSRAGLYQCRALAAPFGSDPLDSRAWPGDRDGLKETVPALNKLLDLDLAIIEDAYQTEYMARLQAHERLATLGQVAGGIAHELRNPLNVVKTSAYYSC